MAALFGCGGHSVLVRFITVIIITDSSWLVLETEDAAEQILQPGVVLMILSGEKSRLPEFHLPGGDLLQHSSGSCGREGAIVKLHGRKSTSTAHDLLGCLGGIWLAPEEILLLGACAFKRAWGLEDGVAKRVGLGDGARREVAVEGVCRPRGGLRGMVGSGDREGV